MNNPVCCLLLYHSVNALQTFNEYIKNLLNNNFYISNTNYISLRDETLLFPKKSYLERTLLLIKPGHTLLNNMLVT